MVDDPQALRAVSLGLILISLIVIALFIIFVHTMPGKIARKRGNPQAEAIEILSLLGLLIFPLWMAALVWAYLRPFSVPVQITEHPSKRAMISEPEAAPNPPSDQHPTTRADTPVGEV
jgi:hypothetical protein